MSQPITAQAPQNNNSPKAPKPVSKWRYRIIIGFLVLIIILMLGGSAYGGWNLWRLSEDRRVQINRLNDEVENLRRDRSVSVEDLQAKLDAQENQLRDLAAENKRINDELTAAKAKVDQLTPKNIRDVNFRQLKNVNEQAGNVWLNPIYADMTGDGREDAIFAYKQAGAGGFLNVYVYSYLDSNTLTEILKAEEYQRGTVAYLADQSIVEIKSQAGTPDAPTVAVTKFKFDGATKRMIRVP